MNLWCWDHRRLIIVKATFKSPANRKWGPPPALSRTLTEICVFKLSSPVWRVSLRREISASSRCNAAMSTWYLVRWRVGTLQFHLYISKTCSIKTIIIKKYQLSTNGLQLCISSRQITLGSYKKNVNVQIIFYAYPCVRKSRPLHMRWHTWRVVSVCCDETVNCFGGVKYADIKSIVT